MENQTCLSLSQALTQSLNQDSQRFSQGPELQKRAKNSCGTCDEFERAKSQELLWYEL